MGYTMIKIIFVTFAVITVIFLGFGLLQPGSVGHYPNFLRLLLLGISAVTGMLAAGLGVLLLVR